MRIWFAASLLLHVAAAQAADRDARRRDVPDKVWHSVVFVESHDGDGQVSRGSGFIVDREGTIFTNRHVVQPDNDSPARLILVGVPFDRVIAGLRDPFDVDYDHLDLFIGRTVHVSPSDSALDFAVLRIAARPSYGSFKPLTLNFEKMRRREPVMTIGFAGGYVPLANRGAVMIATLKHKDVDHCVTTNKTYPGDSGGPMLDWLGRARGIVSGTRKTLYAKRGMAVHLSAVQSSARSAEKLVAESVPPRGPVSRGEVARRIRALQKL